MRIKRWFGFVNEGFDLWSALNNFIEHGTMPGSSELKRKKEELIETILFLAETLWYEHDVEFFAHGVTISSGLDGGTVYVDLSDGCIKFNELVIYFPVSELRALRDRLLQIRQDKLAVPGVRIQDR